MKTAVYVDGFNLFYGALKRTPYKWLDLAALFGRLLPASHAIVSIKYFTAMVSDRVGDPRASTRQDAYLRALRTSCTHIEIIKGHFLTSEVSMRLASPTLTQKYAKVIKTEEKGSDVNLALHVLNDSWLGAYDCAAIVSNDSDLSQALQLVRKQHQREIILLVPGDPQVRPPAIQLKRFAHSIIQITPAALAASQLPDPIPGTNIHKPQGW